MSGIDCKSYQKSDLHDLEGEYNETLSEEEEVCVVLCAHKQVKEINQENTFIIWFSLTELLQSYSSTTSLATVSPCPRCEACDVVILQLRRENEKLKDLVEEHDKIKREVKDAFQIKIRI